MLTDEAGYALVGRFMWDWSALETMLSTLLDSLSKIEPVAGYILEQAMDVRGKISAARSLAALRGRNRGELWLESARKIFAEITALSEDRNVVAHCSFAVDGDAVVFYRTHLKANGPTFDNERWAPERFAEFSNRAYDCLERLDEIRLQLVVPDDKAD